MRSRLLHLILEASGEISRLLPQTNKLLFAFTERGFPLAPDLLKRLLALLILFLALAELFVVLILGALSLLIFLVLVLVDLALPLFLQRIFLFFAFALRGLHVFFPDRPLCRDFALELLILLLVIL